MSSEDASLGDCLPDFRLRFAGEGDIKGYILSFQLGHNCLEIQALGVLPCDGQDAVARAWQFKSDAHMTGLMAMTAKIECTKYGISDPLPAVLGQPS